MNNNFILSERSLAKLEGVHPSLVAVVKKAIEITETDFTISEGLRTLETQMEYVANGASRTMNSKHLIQSDGYAHAVDLCPLAGGKVVNDWKVQWLSEKEAMQAWQNVSQAMKKAAASLDVQIEWGGDWESFKDGPHYQI